ncbi:DUF4179 domain-containing protein [Paenibacillus sp. Marseille-Q7038]
MKDEVEEQNVAQMMKKVSNDASKSQLPKLDTEKSPRNSKKPRNRWSKRLFYITGFTLVFLLVILVLERNGVSEEDRILMEKLSGKLSYLELIRADQTLYNAVKHDLLQDLHITDTDGDYSITVDGLIADEKKAVILYTFTEPNIESGNSLFTQVEITAGNQVPLSSYGYIPARSDDKKNKDKILTDARIYNVEAGLEGNIPETLILTIKIDDKQFNFTIPNDQKHYANMKKTHRIDQNFSIGGQQLTVHEAIITPLASYVTLVADSMNTRQINDLISLSLMNEKEKRYTDRGGYGDLNLTGGYTAQFHSTYFEDSPVYLISEGGYISDRNKKLVINTDTKETLLAPSDQISLSEVIVKEDQIQISILAKDIDNPVPKHSRMFSLLDRNAVFTDAQNTEYKILSDNETEYSHLGESKSEQMSHYSIPKEDYEQPLTFEVHEYPGFVKEKVKVLVDLTNSK